MTQDTPSLPPSGMAHHVLAFSRLCRRAGLPAHPEAAVDACRAFGLLGLEEPRPVYWALRSLLISSPDHIPVFDRLFHAYWEAGPLPGEPETRLPGEVPLARPGLGGAGEEGPDLPAAEARGGASEVETLLRKDLRHLTPEEEPRLRAAFLALLAKLASRPGRRFRPAYRGRAVEFRRVFRQSLRHGGEILRLTRREPRRRRRNLVLLGDVSGSMDPYTRFFFLLAHGLARRDRGVRVFGFSTRLFDLAEPMRDRDAGRAVARVAEISRGWSGGTLIGKCLEELNRVLEATGRRRGLVVVVFSDGWDRGEPGVLRRELARLRGKAWRILWLNPLKGDPDYQPLCRGMAAALPLLDGFHPGHTAESLVRVAHELQRLR